MLVINTTKLMPSVSIVKDSPIIGSKWNGKPADYVDSQNGVYWQSMPTLNDTEKRIQSGLLNKRVPMQDTFSAFKVTGLHREPVCNPN